MYAHAELEVEVVVIGKKYHLSFNEIVVMRLRVSCLQLLFWLLFEQDNNTTTSQQEHAGTMLVQQRTEKLET